MAREASPGDGPSRFEGSPVATWRSQSSTVTSVVLGKSHCSSTHCEEAMEPGHVERKPRTLALCYPRIPGVPPAPFGALRAVCLCLKLTCKLSPRVQEAWMGWEGSGPPSSSMVTGQVEVGRHTSRAGCLVHPGPAGGVWVRSVSAGAPTPSAGQAQRKACCELGGLSVRPTTVGAVRECTGGRRARLSLGVL